MSSIVNDSCTLQFKCVEVCPVDAFHLGPTMVVVDPITCIDCGLCIDACPNNAITTDAEADTQWIAFNAQMASEWKEVTRSTINT